MEGTTFVVCVEPGPHLLEHKALPLFASMRRNMGSWSRAPIWAYSPRPSNPVSHWLRDVLDHYEVRLVEEPLNTRWRDYPLANKPLCLAHAEANAATPYVTFLDTDVLVWREPSAFALPAGYDIALVADGTKTTASSGPGDVLEDYWHRLYELAGASARPYVETILTRERVRGSWNSGVIALRRSCAIAAHWRDAMVAMLAADFAPARARYLRENNLLSAVATAHYDRLMQLPVHWNYPVQNWRQMIENHGVRAEDAVLWHYQPYFNKVFSRFAAQVDQAAGARQRIAMAEALVHDLQRNFRRRLGTGEAWWSSLRRRARIGPRVRAWMGRPKPTDSQA